MSETLAGGADSKHARFSGFPSTVVIAVTLIAAAGLLILLTPEPPPGPPASAGSTTASATPTTSATATASASATTSPPSSSSAEPSKTQAPTPSEIITWTGLTWSDPVTPAFTINLYDLLPWRDGYVAIGQLRSQDAGFLTSPDGVHWTVRHQVRLDGEQVVRHLVALEGSLFAFGQSAETIPSIWRSGDGVRWTRVDSPTWAAFWSDHLFLDVASGPGGLVAIGDRTTGEHDELLGDPAVLRSGDGVSWEETPLDGATQRSVVRDVIGLDGGYALLGGEETGPVTGMGTPQAWWSTDGQRWSRAKVDRAQAGDNHFQSYSAMAGVEGLVARTELLCAGCPPTNRTWISSDGRSWQRGADQGAEPPFGMMAGDGTRIVVLSTKERWTPLGSSPEPYPGLTHAWVSTDGVTWKAMSLSHPLTDQVEAWWVVPDGVVFAGARSFWFGAANTR
jgi:hypothetical protein